MFFVFGSPRSGTTLMAQCLSSHTDIIIPHETDFICAFIGTTFQPGMLNFHNYNARYKGMPAQAKLYTPISTANIGEYRAVLDQKLLCSYERQAQEALETFGYLSGNPKRHYFLNLKNQMKQYLAGLRNRAIVYS